MKYALGPVILILLGLIFLAHNLGFLPFGVLRDFFSTWWPLILIALGVAGLARRR
jgi:uncharacterized integral membrane protein